MNTPTRCSLVAGVLAGVLFCILGWAPVPAAWGATFHIDPAYTGPAGAGTFTSVTAAFAGPAAISGGKSAAEPDVVIIAAGTYQQQVTISQSNVDVVGGGKKYSDTVLTDDLNSRTARPSTGGPRGGTYGTTGASSTFVTGKNVVFANIEFANSTPLGGSQAVAIKTTGDGIAFVNCGFKSFQDTLYVTGGRDYFRDCYIEGNVDFIFGNATAVFERCTINSLRKSGGGITAPNTRPGSAMGLVFLDCTLMDSDPQAKPDEATSGATSGPSALAMPMGSVFLGRPWQYARNSCSSIFINCKMDGHISAAGWSPWDARNTNPAGSTRFAEYNSTQLSGDGAGDGAGQAVDVSKRVKWSHQLSDEQAKEFTLGNIFGPGSFWYGGGYADPKSWPSYWGPLASGGSYNNGGNPNEYSNPGWKDEVGKDGVWDPEGQLGTLPNFLHATGEAGSHGDLREIPPSTGKAAAPAGGQGLNGEVVHSSSEPATSSSTGPAITP
jgi:pectinesterase